ncbi:hypothetical protein EXIGLDRAFT_779674 [Exidia glandulosa HHB12029]|uniref:Uncharacterized protein n=1 Tax=Exidia glandulosa HHB12029 TaxID=1314781 RepID=A0A165BY21_EXIGL|nr:hypothetical protein EXIGLDRAFT_779674 [Exidia glandulosa HHB12029]
MLRAVLALLSIFALSVVAAPAPDLRIDPSKAVPAQIADATTQGGLPVPDAPSGLPNSGALSGVGAFGNAAGALAKLPLDAKTSDGVPKLP